MGWLSAPLAVWRCKSTETLWGNLPKLVKKWRRIGNLIHSEWVLIANAMYRTLLATCGSEKMKSSTLYILDNEHHTHPLSFSMTGSTQNSLSLTLRATCGTLRFRLERKKAMTEGFQSSLSCWGTRTRTRKDRTRICSVANYTIPQTVCVIRIPSWLRVQR